jgi:hypothetical protein
MLKPRLAAGERAVEPHERNRTAFVPWDPLTESGRVLVADARATDSSSQLLPLESGGRLSDPVLAQVANEVWDDPAAVGMVLHGSRATGTAGPNSNYNLIVIVDDAAYDQRSERGTLVERRFSAQSPAIEIEYESLGRLRRSLSHGGSRAGVFASAIVLLDKGGKIERLVSAMSAGGEPAYEVVSTEYNRYLNGFAHSLKSASRGDDLGARAHAAESGLHLVRALFALEGKTAPYLDQLSTRLDELDEAQSWRAGFLRGALLRLFYAPDPPFQQMLDRRMSKLMDSRGIRHEWRPDLEVLRLAKYEEM